MCATGLTLVLVGGREKSVKRITPQTKDCETKLWTSIGVEKAKPPLRGALSDEAIFA